MLNYFQSRAFSILFSCLCSRHNLDAIQTKHSERSQMMFKKISYIFIFIIDKKWRENLILNSSRWEKISYPRIYHGSSYMCIYTSLFWKEEKTKALKNMLHIHSWLTMRARMENTKSFLLLDWRFLTNLVPSIILSPLVEKQSEKIWLGKEEWM